MQITKVRIRYGKFRKGDVLQGINGEERQWTILPKTDSTKSSM